jgi:hypothetical protein
VIEAGVFVTVHLVANDTEGTPVISAQCSQSGQSRHGGYALVEAGAGSIVARKKQKFATASCLLDGVLAFAGRRLKPRDKLGM